MQIKHSITLFFLVAILFGAKAQHYSLYNSGTLAESVENPWVSVFKGTCKKIGTNFFVPSIQGDVFFKGDADKFLRNRAIRNIRMPDSLNGRQDINRINAYSQVNWLTVRMLIEEKHQTEVFFNHATKIIGSAGGKNVAINLVNGFLNPMETYYSPEIGVMNTHTFFNAYNETSIGIRRTFDKTFSAGLKLSYLSGISHGRLEVDYSALAYNNNTDQLTAHFKGQADFSLVPDDELMFSDFLPNFKNPGLSLSFGLEKWINEQSKFTFAVKDLGFIRWKSNPENLSSDDPSTHFITFDNFSHLNWEGAKPKLKEYRLDNSTFDPYTTFLPMRLEAGMSILVHPNYTFNVLGAYIGKVNRGDINLINDFSYKYFHLIVNAGYNTRNQARLGTTFLIKSPTVDFFVGSANLLPSVRAFRYQNNEDYNYDSNSAANLIFGFALKLGRCFGMESPWLNLRDKKGRRRREKCFIF